MTPKSIFSLAIACFMYMTISAQQSTKQYNNNWPQWRGPEANGVAPAGNPPLEWSETKNVKWKIEIPGKGHASPIVWEDKVFIQTAVQTEQKVEKEEPAAEETSERRGPPSIETESIHDFVVMAINRTDGSVIWKTTVSQEVPVDGIHSSATWASNSPVTDGTHLYAYFGSRGLYCMDFDGNIVWKRDLGQMKKKMDFGEGSSPVLHKNKIVVQWDHEGDSYLYIIDKETGKDILKIARDEATTWSSPLIVHANDQDQVITNATNRVRSYDLETGDIIWECTGMTRNVIPNPIVNQGILYLMSGFRGNALMAIDLSKAKGDITGTDAIVWEYNKSTSYTPSALLANNRLYFLRTNNGSLSCVDAADGNVNYSVEKLEGTGTIYASPVAAQDRLYITSKEGITYVIKQGSTFEILSKNVLNDGNFASPAIAGNELFIRGFQYLYCLSEE